MANLIYYCWECNVVQPLWKTFWQFFSKAKLVLLYNSVITLLEIYPIYLKVYFCTKLHTNNIKLFLYTITPKQEACKIVFNRSIGKLWYIYIMTYYSVIKRRHEWILNECRSFLPKRTVWNGKRARGTFIVVNLTDATSARKINTKVNINTDDSCC